MPVLKDTRILGVMAIKFNVAPFEKAWRGGASDIIVTDLSDVVFMSSREDLHFKTLSPLDEGAFARIAETRQYPLDRLADVPNRTRTLSERTTLMTVDGEDFVLNAALLPNIGWRVLHLTPTGPARTQALVAMSLAGLLILLGGLGAAVLYGRRARARARAEEERRVMEMLEARVAQRTRELNDANARLRQEVDERAAAEERLRAMQKELVQAGKLAALGQMSAALSHEINQPLTAVKSYADNAATFLERGRLDAARETIGHISKVADRMAALSSHLRNFARRPQESIGPVDAVLVVEDAIELMGARFRSAGVRLEYAAEGEPCWIKGGRRRLEQVLINLLSNALDATKGQVGPRVRIWIAKAADGWVRIGVSDNGQGLSEQVLEQAFDPFFTTKDPRHGLGLGLSISFNIVEDFGGRLSAINNDDGGATFAVDLAASTAPPEREEPVAQ